MTDNSPNCSNSKNSADSLVGQLLFGEFALTDQLDTYGACQLYKARQITTEIDAVVCTPLMPDPEIIDSFTGAMQQHLALSHKNITKTIACRRLNNGRPVFITEFMNGVTIPDLCSEGALEKAEDISTVLLQVIDALEFAHEKGVYHGDLNPRSLLLCEKNGELVVQVSHFGFVNCRLITERWRSGSTGDLKFIAPEVLAGEPATAAADIYSLGAIGTLLSSGQWSKQSSIETAEAPPFNLNVLRPDLPEVQTLAEILMRATDFEAKKRFQSLSDFRSCITEWLDRTNTKISSSIDSTERQKDSYTDQQCLISDLKQSVHNIVTLKYKQVAQDENVLLRVCETLSAHGPRPSPRKLLTRLVLSTALFVVAVAGLVWAFSNHSNEISTAWNDASWRLNKALKGSEPAQSKASSQLQVSSKSPELQTQKAQSSSLAVSPSRPERNDFALSPNGLNPGEQWPVDKLLHEIPYNANDAAVYRTKNYHP